MKNIYCYKCGKHLGKLNTAKEIKDRKLQNILRKGTVFICKNCNNTNTDSFQGETLENLKSLFGMS